MVETLPIRAGLVPISPVSPDVPVPIPQAISVDPQGVELLNTARVQALGNIQGTLVRRIFAYECVRVAWPKRQCPREALIADSANGVEMWVQHVHTTSDGKRNCSKGKGHDFWTGYRLSDQPGSLHQRRPTRPVT